MQPSTDGFWRDGLKSISTRLDLAPAGQVLFLVLCCLLLLFAVTIVWLGAQILALGGDFYFLAAGLMLLAASLAGLFGWRELTVILLTAVVLLTALWGILEVRSLGWMESWPFDLLGRIAVPAVLLTLFLLTVTFGRKNGSTWAFGSTLAGASVLAGVGLLSIAFVFLHWESVEEPLPFTVQTHNFPGHNTEHEWIAYGGSALGAAYSPAVFVTPDNLDQLDEAWRFRTQDMPPNDRVYFSAQNTPIYAQGLLYTCSPSNKVFALEPASGELVWEFDPKVTPGDMESLFSVACRAVGFHSSEEGSRPCRSSIFLATVDNRLIALDAESGDLCPRFGDQGVVDLADGMGLQETGLASSTSGPAVVGDLVIIGQQVSDNQRRDAPSGVVRAYEARSGHLRWAWDAKRQGIAALPLADGEIYPRGTPNTWNVISGDVDAGLVYIATGNSANDHWGGTRSPEEDRFTSAVVAIDMETGETVWDFATVVHDLWDYDLGAQPALIDLEIDGSMRRVVVQGTKQGSIFILDARSGEPIHPIELRASPSGALPGDWVSESQPQAASFPNFSGRIGPDPELLNYRNTWGVAMIDAALCRRDFLRMDYRGIYTPPSENPHGMLLFPGTVGGINWGGIAVDLSRRILITNHSRLPNVVTMHPREHVEELPVGSGGARPDQDIAPHWLSPWGVTRPMWLSILGAPCIAPPWGYLAATDLNSGRLLWSRAIGTGFDTGPSGVPTFLRVPLGTVNLGGALTTGSGLLFIAAAQDNFLRGFETETGRLLWSARLPAGGQASPMTFIHEDRQYIVIVAGGHQRLETTVGDYVIAFALTQ